jgi:dolichyl-phosphate beta-glucosyltransferase
MALENKLTIVIPIYNEAKRIGSSLERIADYLGQQSYSREIILVDDGSTDEGAAIASRILDGREAYQVIQYGKNHGKGYALRQGMLQSSGKYVLFSDADLSTPIEELDKMWPWLEAGFDIVQGSRKMIGALVDRHQPWLRERMGTVFTWLCNMLVVGDIGDVTCGFKAYTGAVARELYGAQRLADWSFDAEIIFIARKRGYRIKEVPVRWQDRQGTKVRLARDTLRALCGIIRIRLNDLLGYYDTCNSAYSTNQL